MTDIEKSQADFMQRADQVTLLRCPNANDEQCKHPACGCHCAPVKAEAFEPFQFERLQIEYADREPKRAINWLLAIALVAVIAAIFIVLLNQHIF